jgi:hypothetical protein
LGFLPKPFTASQLTRRNLVRHSPAIALAGCRRIDPGTVGLRYRVRAENRDNRPWKATVLCRNVIGQNIPVYPSWVFQHE